MRNPLRSTQLTRFSTDALALRPYGYCQSAQLNTIRHVVKYSMGLALATRRQHVDVRRVVRHLVR